MAIICRSYRLLFLMTPRTACTAVGELLCREFGGEYIPKQDILDSKGFIQVQKKHCTLADIINHRLLTKEEAFSFLSFTTVRNPFDSLVSLYIKKKIDYKPLLSDRESWVYRLPGYARDMRFCQNNSFNAWIFRNFWKRVIKQIVGLDTSMYRPFTEGVDMIIHFEDLENGFRNVLKEIGVDYKNSIPLVNVTSDRSKDYRIFYSRSARKIVELVFKRDLTRYGYDF